MDPENKIFIDLVFQLIGSLCAATSLYPLKVDIILLR